MSRMPLGMRVVAALALVASGLVLQSRAPAVAAGCSGSTGVTVVVDHHQLGGGVQQACDADGGGKAASTVFPDSGFPLTVSDRTPKHGTRQYVVARGLAAGERVTVSYRGRVVARGTAGPHGRFRGSFRAGPAGTRTLKVTGQFPSIRHATTSLRVG